MREYGQIQSAFWYSSDCSEFSDQGKLLAAYLMTGPATTALGCFVLGDGGVMDHLGWAPEKTAKGFAELSRNGFAYRFGTVVFLPKFLHWNRILNGNIAKARFLEWEQLPRGPLKAYAARAMLEFSDYWTPDHKRQLETVSQTVTETVRETPLLNEKTQTRPDQTITNQDQNTFAQNGKPERTKPKVKPVPERFAEFWTLYPRKVSKADAVKALGKLKPAEVDAAMVALPSHIAHWQATGTEPQFIPYPASWLNGRKWEDELRTSHTHRAAAQPKQSRQSAIFEILANDHRYANTASRVAGARHTPGLPAARAALPGLRSGAGDDPDDADVLDADFSEQGHR